MSTHQDDSDSEFSSEAEDSHMGEHIGEFEDLDVLSRAFLNAVGLPPRRTAPPSPPATYVVDRRGAHVAVQFDKITARNEALRTNPKYGPVLAAIDSSAITAEIVRRFRNGMTTRELDVETAATCADRASHHSDYEWLAARVHVNDLHKRTPRGLGEMVRALAAAAADARCVRLSPEYAAIVERASAAIDARLEFSRDYRLRHFGFQTMARGYLLRPGARSEESSLLDTQLMERPQHLYMRIALGIFVCRADKRGHEAPEEAFGRRLAAAFQLYDALSLQLVSHATPTILNAGTKVTQLSSCFQTATGDDLHQLLLTHLHIGDISKWSGGVSLWLHNVRAEGALIRGTGGRSTGLKHYVRMLNDLQMYVDQGGNRPGAFAIYLSVDHDDIFTLLAQGRLKGEETLKEVAAPDLKLALWVSDLYMEALAAQLRNAAAVEAGEPDDPEAGDWYLFCPDEAPGLHLTWGDAYRELYERYVAEGRYRRRVKAGDIMEAAFKNWAQGGTPYVVNKCPVNRKSNMQNVAPICSSNLCVAGDTFVLTETGHAPISSLRDHKVAVWNGAEWSPVVPRKTGDDAKLVRVELSDGGRLDCTAYHKFYVVADGKTAERRAGALRPGDMLEACPEWPVVGAGEPLPHAYTAGVFAAIGYNSDGAPTVDLPPELESLYSHISLGASTGREEPSEHTLVSGLPPLNYVPFGRNMLSRLEWFAGFCDAAGDASCMTSVDLPSQPRNMLKPDKDVVERAFTIRVRSPSAPRLARVKLMLQTLGCDAAIVKCERSSECGGEHALIIRQRAVATLLELGFRTRRLDVSDHKVDPRNRPTLAHVVSVAELPGTHATFCFTEPKLHRGVFGGVYCGQCVTADTFILTDAGHLPIGELEDQEVQVWNGVEMSSVIVRRTNASTNVVRVVFDNGEHIDCTPYHKFYIYKQAACHVGVREVRAGELREGDRLEKSPKWPVIECGARLAHAYTSGFFAADGHYTKGQNRCQNPATDEVGLCWHHRQRQPLWEHDGQCRAWCGYNTVNLYGVKKMLLDALDVHPDCVGLYNHVASNRLTVNLVDDLLPKTSVPQNADLGSRVEWFTGLCDGDGCAIRQGSSYSLQITSINREFLIAVRRMLQTMGCDPKVRLDRDARRETIRGAEYECKSAYRLLVCSYDLDTLFSIGFQPQRLAFPGYARPARDTRHPIKVCSITALPGEQPTFCFTEPKLHRGVFNGVRAGNCEEITIPSWSEFDAPEFAQFHPGNAAGGEYGVCNLAAVALESFIRVDAEVTFDFAGEAAAAGLECRALNAVIDLNYNPSEECRRSNHRHRPIGIGLIGFADALARKREAYGTREAARFARGIAATLYFGAMQASAALAETDGPYETFEGSPVSRGLLQPDLWVADGSLAPGWEAEVEDATGGFIKPADWAALRARCRRGVRNAYVTAYMPTATTSNIVGQNECFEPFTSNLYVRKTLAGEFTIVNRHLMAELVAAGLWDDRMRREVIAAGGSIQGIERIPADVRRRYRTAREIHPSLFIRMVKAMAPFVCQSMSLNLYLNEPDLPKILRFLIEGWREGLKSLSYYIHTKSAAGSQKTSVRALTYNTADVAPTAEETPQQVCSRTNREACTSCAL